MFKKESKKLLEDRAAVLSAAVDLLARREYSAAELERKLLEKTANPDDVASALETLQEKGYQSDERCVAMFINQRVSQAYGLRRIENDLRQKGIGNELTQSALEAAEIDWFELAARAYEKRYGQTHVDDFKEKAKRQRHLLSRGFSFDEINYALNVFKSN